MSFLNLLQDSLRTAGYYYIIVLYEKLRKINSNKKNDPYLNIWSGYFIDRSILLEDEKIEKYKNYNFSIIDNSLKFKNITFLLLEQDFHLCYRAINLEKKSKIHVFELLIKYLHFFIEYKIHKQPYKLKLSIQNEFKKKNEKKPTKKNSRKKQKISNKSKEELNKIIINSDNETIKENSDFSESEERDKISIGFSSSEENKDNTNEIEIYSIEDSDSEIKLEENESSLSDIINEEFSDSYEEIISEESLIFEPMEYNNNTLDFPEFTQID